MTAIATKARKASQGKNPSGSRKPARRKARANATLAVSAKGKLAGQTNQASFNKILDEVIRDYSSTLRKLA